MLTAPFVLVGCKGKAGAPSSETASATDEHEGEAPDHEQEGEAHEHEGRVRKVKRPRA